MLASLIVASMLVQPSFAAGFGGQGASRPAVQDLAWLAGCWELTRGTRRVTEQWMRPEGGTLMGMSRTTADGTTVEYEFLIIREGAMALEFVAKPSGQPEAVFTATRVAAREVVFENPMHDFPTRITYRATGDGGLLAAVEGDVKGQRQTLQFPYRRVACGR
ncbi:MAG: hypothetical protein HY657_18965 [Acidobacteria bacterium]|nr:hypothetical protein [Acidobacteriota bacterium]